MERYTSSVTDPHFESHIYFSLEEISYGDIYDGGPASIIERSHGME